MSMIDEATANKLAYYYLNTQNYEVEKQNRISRELYQSYVMYNVFNLDNQCNWHGVRLNYSKSM